MWASAPGLMMMPRATLRCSWMKSMSAPSWFDWKGFTTTFQPAQASRTMVSTSARVVRP